MRACLSIPSNVYKLLTKNKLLNSSPKECLFNIKKVRDIHMVAEAFTVENNLLTPTFKLKRVESRAKYKDVIAEMYAKMK